MQSSEEEARAAELLERLLTDEAFRASFRRDPAAACRDAELPELAGEFGAGGGNKMLHTLEIRESRSSLAGAFMAAASEGTGAVDHLRRMHESSNLPGDTHRVVHKALTSPKLQAVDPNAIHPQGAVVDQLSNVSGGTPAPVAVASPDDIAPLLDSPQLSLSPEAYAALARGGADARLVSVLEDLSQSHQLQIGTIQTTGGGGDALEILAVDGEPVSPGNIAARDLANELASLDPSLQPSQIVTPWPIDSPGFSTDQYSDRIQIVFDAPAAAPPPPVDVTTPPDPGAGTPPDPTATGDGTPPPPPPPPDPTTTPPPPPPNPADTGTPPPPPPDPSPTPDPSTTDPTSTGDPPPPVDPTPPPPPPDPTPPPPPPDPTPPPPVDVTPPPPPVDVTPPPPPPEPVVIPPPEAATPPPSHQSLVLGAVNEPQARSTMQFQAPVDHAAEAGGSGAAAAFDPNVAGVLPDVSDTYPGDNAPKEAIAAWMARQAHKAGLPAELPIMAGLTESGLQNVRYGDRDSLGFFQMRTSIWNQGEYAGFSDHPELQLKWFIDHALAVRQERITQGDTKYGQDRSKWGDWVADVEQPAAEYRGRYQTHLDEADSLLTSGGGGGAGTAGTADAVAAMQSAYVGGGSAVGVQALQIAERYMGTPYKWGGASPETGFDCSGLVQWSYHQMGIDLPRVTDQQFQVGVHISNVDDLRPGDIVFFRDSTGYIHHEGMYIGNHQFVHAPHTGDVIKISSLDEPYYKEQFAGGSDVSGLGGGGGAVPPPPPPPPVPEAAPATPAPPDPAAARSGGGTGESGLFGAVPEPGSGSGDSGTPDPGSGSSSPGSTVQILPAVKDPDETT